MLKTEEAKYTYEETGTGEKYMQKKFQALLKSRN